MCVYIYTYIYVYIYFIHTTVMLSLSLFKALVATDCINVTYVSRTLVPYIFPVFNSYRAGQSQYICILRKQN